LKSLLELISARRRISSSVTSTQKNSSHAFDNCRTFDRDDSLESVARAIHLFSFILSQLYPNGEVSLGLSTAVKSHKPPEPSETRQRSGKAQTTYSKRMTRNCLARLEKRHGKHNLAFATYTLPDLPTDQLKTLSAKSGVIANRLVQEIKRDLERAGITAEIVWVVEIQEKRFDKTGAIAIHFHVVFQSRKNRYSPYAISKERNTEIWNRIISNALGYEIEMPYAANIQKIKKSAENYMSKYMSKGSKVAQKLADRNQIDLLPKNWWGATLSLRKWVKDHIKLLVDSSIDYIRNNYKAFINNLKDSPFTWLHAHTITLVEPHGEEIEFPVAIVGKIKPNSMHLFQTKTLVDDAVMSWEW